MSYTLISSIGTGMYKDGYKTTNYQFPDKHTETTNWFLQALIKAKYRDFSKVILVGTNTSNWDALIDLSDESAEGLWEQLSQKNADKTGITLDLIEPLENQLTKQYGIPFEIFVHTDKIDEVTTTEVFNVYHKMIPSISKNTDILFDITHGFRSMPILMYQNLQLVFSNNCERKVEFVYGEYLKNQDISYVRDLSNFWFLSQISDAMNIFETKLDGYKLAELIKSDWPAGSKAIIRLSDIIQTNFALQFPEALKQVSNALNKLPHNISAWVLEIKTFLEIILKIEDKKSISRTLYNYSKFLFDLHLNTQAVITLQVAVEAAIVEKYGNPETDMGNWDWISTEGHDKLKSLRNKNYKELDCIFNLERFRNQIAHGGGKSKDGGFPSASNIPGIYKSGLRGIENLFSILEI